MQPDLISNHSINFLDPLHFIHSGIKHSPEMNIVSNSRRSGLLVKAKASSFAGAWRASIRCCPCQHAFVHFPIFCHFIPTKYLGDWNKVGKHLTIHEPYVNACLPFINSSETCPWHDWISVLYKYSAWTFWSLENCRSHHQNLYLWVWFLYKSQPKI